MASKKNKSKWDYIPIQHKNPLKAIREGCITCMGGGKPYKEIEECASTDCPLYAFRFGKNPYRKPPTEKQRKARARNLSKVVHQPQSGRGRARQN